MTIAVWVSVLGLAVAVVAHAIYVSHRLGAYEQKVDMMFGIWYEDVKRDGLKRGYFVKQSPVRLSDDTLKSILKEATPETMAKAVLVLVRPKNKQKLDNAEVIQWVTRILGEELIRERAEVFDLPHSTYLATWILAVREADLVGAKKFTKNVIRMYNELHPDDPFICPFVELGKDEK
jgi:hypothetical protein